MSRTAARERTRDRARDGVREIEGSAEAADGTPLHLRRWSAPGKPWATMLIVHGISEHSGRYDRAARIAARAGMDVHAFDLRGHGKSGGPRMYVDDWGEFLDDLEERTAAVREPGRPFVLFGHSMGSLICLTYLLDGHPAPDLVVLSAAPLAAAVPVWQRAAAPILSRLLPRLVIANPIDGGQLSRDPAVGEAYFADPLVQPRSTARLGAELFRAMKCSRDNLDRLCQSGIPILVIHGGDDTLVPTRVSEPLARIPGVERRVLPGLRHETLNEPEGPEVMAEIVEWLRAYAGGLPAENC
jgi:alpha-beta hydrolase superfamily lysophospholipase